MTFRAPPPSALLRPVAEAVLLKPCWARAMARRIGVSPRRDWCLQAGILTALQYDLAARAADAGLSMPLNGEQAIRLRALAREAYGALLIRRLRSHRTDTLAELRALCYDRLCQAPRLRGLNAAAGTRGALALSQTGLPPGSSALAILDRVADREAEAGSRLFTRLIDSGAARAETLLDEIERLMWHRGQHGELT